jgi:hypothetical protein
MSCVEGSRKSHQANQKVVVQALYPCLHRLLDGLGFCLLWLLICKAWACRGASDVLGNWCKGSNLLDRQDVQTRARASGLLVNSATDCVTNIERPTSITISPIMRSEALIRSNSCASSSARPIHVRTPESFTNYHDFRNYFHKLRSTESEVSDFSTCLENSGRLRHCCFDIWWTMKLPHNPGIWYCHLNTNKNRYLFPALCPQARAVTCEGGHGKLVCALRCALHKV